MILAKEIPVVCKALLDDPRHPRAIPLDTPAWFAWLDAPTTTRFAYAYYNHAAGYIDGFMTLRKEPRQRGGAYWVAYRRHGRRLRKGYLGRSANVTAAALAQVAARLRRDRMGQ
ncbi:MAG: hypothetical protein R3C14_23935 [Caldilineaceae bacterium]